MGQAFQSDRQYERAIAEYRKALEKAPRRPRLHFRLGATYVLNGQLPEGIAELETAVKLSQGNPRFLAYLGYAYAAAENKSEVRKTLEELNVRSRQGYVSPYGIALIHMGLGDNETALRWLERSYEVRAFELAELRSDPRLDALRSDPHFQDLVRRIGLAQ